MELTGIHHLTAVTAQASRNHDFYTRVLGMRLVKKTVNQDDTSAYHLFYADVEATPGSDLTFFDWPVGPERRGTHSITRTGLRVTGETSLRWWKERLSVEGVTHDDIVVRDGRLTLDLEDFEGQRLSLLDDGGAGEAHTWARSPVPAEHQIRDYATPGNEGSQTYVYEMGRDGAAAELHVAVEPNLPVARPGAGSVHHVAFRIPDAEYEAWAERLKAIRMPSSGPVDRFYFRSLYFREPGGILFEIATDGPGFATDEPLETLGESLSLPPFLESRRQQIERGLKPL